MKFSTTDVLSAATVREIAGTAAKRNTAYRRVVYTSKTYQVVLMSLRPGEDIGAETHKHVEQDFLVVSGHGAVTIAGRKMNLFPGVAFTVPKATRHNVKNTGKTAMKLVTIYWPPNHIDGTVHMTKADAKRDVEDEEFGKGV